MERITRANAAEYRALKREALRAPRTDFTALRRQLAAEALQQTQQQPTDTANQSIARLRTHAAGVPKRKRVFIGRSLEIHDEFELMAKALVHSPRIGSLTHLDNSAKFHVTVLHSVAELLSPSLLQQADENIADCLIDTVPMLKDPKTIAINGLGLFGNRSLPTVGMVCDPENLEPERAFIIGEHGIVPDNKLQKDAMRTRIFHVSVMRDVVPSYAETVKEVLEPCIPHDIYLRPAEIRINGRHVASA